LRLVDTSEAESFGEFSGIFLKDAFNDLSVVDSAGQLGPSLHLGQNPTSILFPWIWDEIDPVRNLVVLTSAIGKIAG
jgi:hypothetical protein